MFAPTGYRERTTFEPCFFQKLGSCRDQKTNYICNGHLMALFDICILPVSTVDATNNREYGLFVFKSELTALRIPWFLDSNRMIKTSEIQTFAMDKMPNNAKLLSECLVNAYTTMCCNPGDFDFLNNTRYVIKMPGGDIASCSGADMPPLIKIIVNHMQVSNLKGSEQPDSIISASIPTVQIEINPDTGTYELRQINPALIHIYQERNKNNHITLPTPLIIAGYGIRNYSVPKTLIQVDNQFRC